MRLKRGDKTPYRILVGKHFGKSHSEYQLRDWRMRINWTVVSRKREVALIDTEFVSFEASVSATVPKS